MTLDGVCEDCRLPTKGTLCGECRAIRRAEERTRETRELNTRLPPRLPEPPSLRWCPDCGALSGLATWHGVTKCGDCWRRAA